MYVLGIRASPYDPYPAHAKQQANRPDLMACDKYDLFSLHRDGTQI